MSLELHELVAEARSPCSTSVTDSPRPAASRAMPAPLMPPPMTRRSIIRHPSEGWGPVLDSSLRGNDLFAPFVPPQQPHDGLGVRDDAIAHPIERVGHAGLEDLEVLAHVESGAHVREAARAVELDHLVGIADRGIEVRDLPPLGSLVAALLDELALGRAERR